MKCQVIVIHTTVPSVTHIHSLIVGAVVGNSPWCIKLHRTTDAINLPSRVNFFTQCLAAIATNTVLLDKMATPLGILSLVSSDPAFPNDRKHL